MTYQGRYDNEPPLTTLVSYSLLYLQAKEDITVRHPFNQHEAGVPRRLYCRQ